MPTANINRVISSSARARASPDIKISQFIYRNLPTIQSRDIRALSRQSLNCASSCSLLLEYAGKTFRTDTAITRCAVGHRGITIIESKTIMLARFAGVVREDCKTAKTQSGRRSDSFDGFAVVKQLLRQSNVDVFKFYNEFQSLASRAHTFFAVSSPKVDLQRR